MDRYSSYEKFYEGYYSNPASDLMEIASELQARCTTKSLTSDDKKKILLECKALPVPYNLFCAAQIVRNSLSDDDNNICRHYTVRMIDAAQVLGFRAYMNGGNPPPDEKGDGHAWAEVVVDGKRYICDAHGQKYISMDGPIAPYCGNNKKEKGEVCDGNDRKDCDLYTERCESCKCVKEKKHASKGMSKNTKIGLGTAAAATVILLANNSGSNANDTEIGNTTPIETVTPDTDQPPEAAPEPVGDSRDGNYNVATTVASNPANHPVLIQNLVLHLQVVDAVLTITQISNNNNFPRQFTAALAAGAFNAIVSGNYAGFNTIFQIAGTLNALNQLTFQLIVGGNGSLPTGQPITYNAQGSK